MRRGSKNGVVRKGFSEAEMHQLKDEKEKPHEDRRAGTELSRWRTQ